MTHSTATRTVAALAVAVTCLLAAPGAAHAATADGGHLLYRDVVLPVWDPHTKATLQTSTVHEV